MASIDLSVPTVADGTKEASQRRSSRGPAVPSLARKATQLLEQIEQIARSDFEKYGRDHERVRALLNTATGGGVEKLLRASRVLTEDDKEFLRDLGWRV